MPDLPGSFGPNNRYQSYSNAPSCVTDAAGVEFRGLLVSDTSLDPDQLVYVVVRMDTKAVIWASPPGAGSGSISAAPSGPLKVVWDVKQGKGTPTSSITIPNVFTPFLVTEATMRALLAAVALEIRGNIVASGAMELNRAIWQKIVGHAAQHDPVLIAEIGVVYNLHAAPHALEGHPQAEYPDQET